MDPRRAPGRRLYHQDWRTAYIANSTRGAVLAQRAGCTWIDNDFHLTLNGQAWGNEHGAPSRLWFGAGDRMERHMAADVFKMQRTVGGHTYHIRNAREALADNHAHGLSTEFEVKDVHPCATPAILDAAFARLAGHAAQVYGADWQHHLEVKVLTNLAGGVPYALKVCTAAHAHGIPTMLLARGWARFNRFAGHAEVTYVRGSLVIR